MATYEELLAAYNGISLFQQWRRDLFLRQHPKFAKRLAGGLPGSPGIEGIPDEIPPPGPLPPGPGQTAQPPDVPEAEQSPRPTDPLPEGWDWVWDGTRWVPQEIEIPEDEEEAAAQRKYQNDLYSQYKRTLEEFGLLASEDFLHEAIREDWSEDTFIIRMREQDFYLANPLFRANLNRAKQGKGFDSEGTVLAYADSLRQIARAFGYAEPSDNLIAMSIEAKGTTAKSAAEFESKVRAWQRLEDFGRPIAAYAEEYLGRNLSDEDLFEFFDPDIPDPEWVKAFKYAEYQGRPILLGFEGRSQAEARAYEMLGLSPDEVFSRFGQARDVKTRSERLALIEGDLIGNMDRDALRTILKGHEDLVVQASVLQLPDAQMRLQELLLREGARWRQRGGAVATASGQLVGLLGQEERATYG